MHRHCEWSSSDILLHWVLRQKRLGGWAQENWDIPMYDVVICAWGNVALRLCWHVFTHIAFNLVFDEARSCLYSCARLRLCYSRKMIKLSTDTR